MTQNLTTRLDLALLDRYLAGTATPEERSTVDVMLERDQHVRTVVRLLREAGAPTTRLQPGSADSAWQRDWARINAVALDEHRGRQEDASSARASLGARSVNGDTVRRRWPGKAGVLPRVFGFTGVALAGIVAFVATRPHRTQTSGVTRSYTTGANQHATVALPDSTRVMLGPSTTVRLQNFGVGTRAISVDGQIYVDVARSEGSPFVVRTGAITTRVLGTSFGVKHIAGDERVLVSVAEGKVRVANDAAPERGVTLTAGSIGEWRDTTAVVSTVDQLAPGTELVRDKLVFRHAPLSSVLATLSRWYGYEFRCSEPELARQYVTVGVSTRSSSAALAALEEVLSVNLIVVGDTITITSQDTRPSKAPSRVRTYDVWTPTREVGR